MKQFFLVSIFYCLLSIIVTWPLPLHLNTLINDPHDSLLNVWILNWGIHALTSGIGELGNFFNGNIYFPYKFTYAFSDYHLPLAALVLPFTLFFGEPLIAFNLSIIFGFYLTAITAYYLGKHLTHSIAIGIFSGVLLSFSISHFNYMSHQQSFHIWPLVLGCYFILKKRYVLFVLSGFIASLTTVAFFYYFLAIGICDIASTIALSGQTLKLSKKELINVLKQAFSMSNRPVVISLIVLGCLVAPWFVPFLIVSRTFNYTRPLTDVIHFSLKFHDFLNISPVSRIFPLWGTFVPGTPAFLGGVFMVTGLLSLINTYRQWSRKLAIIEKKNLYFFTFLFSTALILSLGPAFHIFAHTIHVGPIPAIPMPYLIFYYLLPGFAGSRTPSRWLVLIAIALMALIAIYLKKRISRVAIFFLCSLVFLELNLPIPFTKVPSVSEFPPEQLWLKENYKNEPIIQMPIYNWSDFSYIGVETLREYYSTIHWHPMFNGYSGFSPEEWQSQVGWLGKEFPSEETLQFIKDKKIKLILVPSDWKARMQPFNQVELIEEFPNTLIYKVQ